jgi:hypothetical protein
LDNCTSNHEQFSPATEEASLITIDKLTIEIRTQFIASMVPLDPTRDKRDLAYARALKHSSIKR